MKEKILRVSFRLSPREQLEIFRKKSILVIRKKLQKKMMFFKVFRVRKSLRSILPSVADENNKIQLHNS